MMLEVSAALRRATKGDLFSGNINDLKGRQWIKENTTVFFRKTTGELSGPNLLSSSDYFPEVYSNMAFGLLGVIVPFPNVTTNEIIFDLVLREASIDDLKYTPRQIKLNRMYYTYCGHALLGPFYTDNSTTSLYLENLVVKNQVFVPNERQHFKNKTLQKAG